MASRYRPLPVHSGSARALCLGSTAQGRTYKHRETRMHMALVHCGFLSLIHSFQGVRRLVLRTAATPVVWRLPFN